MAKKPNHTAAGRKPDAISLFALPSGGFEVRDPMWRDALYDGRGDMLRTTSTAAFTTLDEALAWLRVNMAQPALEAA